MNVWACIQIRRRWKHIAAYHTAVTRNQFHRPSLLLYVYFCATSAAYFRCYLC